MPAFNPVVVNGLDRGEAYAHLYASSGTGTEANPYVSADGTGGIGGAIGALARGGKITLAASRFGVTTAPSISYPSITLAGVSRGANIDPNGESEGVNGTKIRTTTDGVRVAFPSGSSARLGGVNVQNIYVWGAGKNGYNSQAGINVTTAQLDQAHFTDCNFGNLGAGIFLSPNPGSAQLDTPYITRCNALHCSFGLVAQALGMIYAHVTDCCFSDIDSQGIALNPSGGKNHFEHIVLVRCAGSDGSSSFPNSAVQFSSQGNELVDCNIENTGARLLAGGRSNFADGVQFDGSYNTIRGGRVIQTVNGAGVHVRNNSTGCRIENVYFSGNSVDIKIDAGCSGTIIECPGQTLNITDAGTRTIINNTSVNAGDPDATGQWNGNTKPAGLFIRDTTNSVTYLYLGGSNRTTV